MAGIVWAMLLGGLMPPSDLALVRPAQAEESSAPTPVSSEITVVVYREQEGHPAGVYTFTDETALAAGNLPAGSFVRLSSAEIARLQAGETLLVSDRMPMIDEMHTAWGIAFSPVPSKDLFELTNQYANYPKHFSDVLSLTEYPGTDGQTRAVYILKEAAVDVGMVITYEWVEPSHKVWHKTTETDLTTYFSPEVADVVRAKQREDDDFTFNSGGWYFIDSNHPALGSTYRAVIVRNAAVKLSGFIGMLKGPKAIKKSVEKEMPYTMGTFVDLAQRSFQRQAEGQAKP